MKKNLWILIILALVLTSMDGYGQRWKLQRYEAEAYVSGVSFHGDIGLANKPLLNNINGFRPSVGIKPSFRITSDMDDIQQISQTPVGCQLEGEREEEVVRDTDGTGSHCADSVCADTGTHIRGGLQRCQFWIPSEAERA